MKLNIRMINRILKWLIATSGVVMLILWAVDGQRWDKPQSYIATLFVPFIPDLLRVCKAKPSDKLVLAFELFLIVALMIGINLDWYATVMVTEDGNSYYDKIVHGASGMLSAFAANEVFVACCPRSNKKVRQAWLMGLFILGAVALIAVGWECFEFSYDKIAGGHMQELVKAGLDDTMWDLIMAMMGGTIAMIPLVAAWVGAEKE